MCDFEEFVFLCNHSQFRLKSYCHFARNDPNHQCFGVKKLRHVWDQADYCDECVSKARSSQWHSAQASYGYDNFDAASGSHGQPHHTRR